MVQWLRALPAPEDDPRSVSSIHMAAHSFRGFRPPLLDSQGTKPMWYTDIYSGKNTYIYKIKKLKSKNV